MSGFAGLRTTGAASVAPYAPCLPCALCSVVAHLAGCVLATHLILPVHAQLVDAAGAAHGVHCPPLFPVRGVIAVLPWPRPQASPSGLACGARYVVLRPTPYPATSCTRHQVAVYLYRVSPGAGTGLAGVGSSEVMVRGASVFFSLS